MMRGVATVALLGLIILCLVPWTFCGREQAPAMRQRGQRNRAKAVSRSSKTELKDNSEGKTANSEKLSGHMDESNGKCCIQFERKTYHSHCKADIKTYLL